MELLLALVTDIQPGRLFESLIVLGVFWAKITPHLKKIEARMEGMEGGLNRIDQNMKVGFDTGETRFNKIEARIALVESGLKITKEN